MVECENDGCGQLVMEATGRDLGSELPFVARAIKWLRPPGKLPAAQFFKKEQKKAELQCTASYGRRT